MTEAERKELAALNAYWPRATEAMPDAQYRRWCDLQIMARDASADTRPQGGDAKQAPFTSGAVVAEGEQTPEPPLSHASLNRGDGE